jgi:outer membrane biosynthesis protein TonB
MTSAFAPAILAGPAHSEKGVLSALAGAQNLLALKPARQNYIAEAVAIGVYALILAAGLNYQAKPQAAPPEEPMELVLEQPAPPPVVEQPKPPEPEAVKPPEPQVEEPPPPPKAIEPAVAPVEPPKPKPVVPPKTVVPPKPKPKPVARAPERQVAAPSHPVAAAAPVRAAPVPAGATASAIANQIHMRLARAAANSYPESQKPRSARISYRVIVDAAGRVTSFSITPSGNAAFDAVAQRLGGRIGTVDSPGRAAALSGVITFAYQ